MNEKAREFDDSTIQRAKRFEEICDEFETLCSGENRPSIETFLKQVETAYTQSLLVELIAIEMHYRRRRGETIAFSDYQARFPEVSNSWFDETVQKEFAKPMNPLGNNNELNELGLDRLRSYFQTSNRPGWLGRLSHYELERTLGQGAFGIVVKAFDERLHRVVAIKFMNPELAATSPPRKRFLREARTAAAIRHENIVGIHAIEEEPLPYIVMEYIPGITLQQWLDQNGPLELPEFLRIAQQIAAGLAAAHAVNLIHRDIKPSNILLESGVDKRAKISDFGLARAVDDASLTSSGLIAGTPMYMAPEQARGEVLDHRADLFSLGSVLYQMVSGRPPFRAANTVAVLKRVCEETPRPIQDVIPETPDWVCTIIERLLEKKPTDRYQTAKEVADLLARSQAELKLNGKVASIGHRESRRNLETQSIRRGAIESNVSTGNSTAGAFGLNRLSKFTKRNRTRLLCSVVLTTIAFSSFFFFRYRDPGAETKNSNLEIPITSNQNQESKIPMSTEASHVWPADAPPPAIAPFDAEMAKQLQEAWARYLNVPVEFTNSIGMTFRLIPPGEFAMGMTVEEAESIASLNEKDGSWKQMILSAAPVHPVRITNPFYMSIHEVTQKQFESLTDSNPSYFSEQGEGAGEVQGKNTDEYPVETVTPVTAERFCNKLSLSEKRTTVYNSSSDVIHRLVDGYRLPTEAEWEGACRSGTTTTWSNGNRLSELASVAWFGEGRGGPHPVGQLNSNPFGLFDMHGNVWEWCQDLYDPDFYSRLSKEVVVDPIGPETGEYRVFRGGSWFIIPPLTRSSIRFKDWPTGKGNQTGFRVALSISKSKSGGSVVPSAPVTLAVQNKETEASPLGQGWYGWPDKAPATAIAPFDSDQAKHHQEAWAKYLKVPVEFTNSIGMKFRLIPPGEFLMGMAVEDADAIAALATDKAIQQMLLSSAPMHRVVLTRSFYLSVHEVTQSQFKTITGTNPSGFSPHGQGAEMVKDEDTDVFPAENVSASDAEDFCNKLSLHDMRQPHVYRLPTEAEWEWACRAGTTTTWSHGNNASALPTFAWFGPPVSSRTHPVGQLISNPFGLFDMHGNVMEWCQDWHGQDYYKLLLPDVAVDPIGPETGFAKVVRGGNWSNFPLMHGSACRFKLIPTGSVNGIGFRVALSVPEYR